MAADIRLGIDFGTSNTVAVLRWSDGRTRTLLFDGSPQLPSAVYADPSGRLLVGRDAVRSARIQPECFERNPKRLIDDGTVLLGNAEIPVVDLIAAVLRQVRSEALRITGGAPIREVVITHPVAWGTPRRSRLIEAAARAGLGRPYLVNEPVAAAAYFTMILRNSLPDGRCLVVYDFGAGTFDATVVRRTGDQLVALASEGLADVGGLDIDAAIVGAVKEAISADYPEEWERLSQPTTSADRRLRDQLWEDVRGVKEMLSRTPQAFIHVPLIDKDIPLGREELEQLARPLLEQTVNATAAVLRTVPASTVAGVFLVGGSSRIPLVATLLHRALRIAPLAIEQPELVVAEGAAVLPLSALRTVPPNPTQGPRPGGGGPPRPGGGGPRYAAGPPPVGPRHPARPPAVPHPHPHPAGPRPAAPPPVGGGRPPVPGPPGPSVPNPSWRPPATQPRPGWAAPPRPGPAPVGPRPATPPGPVPAVTSAPPAPTSPAPPSPPPPGPVFPPSSPVSPPAPPRSPAPPPPSWRPPGPQPPSVHAPGPRPGPAAFRPAPRPMPGGSGGPPRPGAPHPRASTPPASSPAPSPNWAAPAPHASPPPRIRPAVPPHPGSGSGQGPTPRAPQPGPPTSGERSGSFPSPSSPPPDSATSTTAVPRISVRIPLERLDTEHSSASSAPSAPEARSASDRTDASEASDAHPFPEPTTPAAASTTDSATGSATLQALTRVRTVRFVLPSGAAYTLAGYIGTTQLGDNVSPWVVPVTDHQEHNEQRDAEQPAEERRVMVFRSLDDLAAFIRAGDWSQVSQGEFPWTDLPPELAATDLTLTSQDDHDFVLIGRLLASGCEPGSLQYQDPDGGWRPVDPGPGATARCLVGDLTRLVEFARSLHYSRGSRTDLLAPQRVERVLTPLLRAAREPGVFDRGLLMQSLADHERYRVASWWWQLIDTLTWSLHWH